MQILLVEDDRRISGFLVKGLEENGFLVTLCGSAEEVVQDYLGIAWDLIILDIMLPGMDGIQLIQTLRHKKVFAPILMLSALSTVQDKVSALDYGADDYMTKPFHFDELLSRINAMTRRRSYTTEQNPTHKIQFEDLEIDLEQYQVKQNGQTIELSPREFKLLNYLLENKHKAVSRVQIRNAVWGISFDNHTNVVDVYISYLRSKLERDERKYIQTVKGVGYMLKAGV